jgi:hypothetical protein
MDPHRYLKETLLYFLRFVKQDRPVCLFEIRTPSNSFDALGFSQLAQNHVSPRGRGGRMR